MDLDLEALGIQVTDLAARVTRLEERYRNLIYKLEAVHRRSDEVQYTTDARIDALYAEQLEPKQVQELLGAIYDLGARLSGLEERMTTLELQQAGE